jgi:hypothetical protein
MFKNVLTLLVAAITAVHVEQSTGKLYKPNLSKQQPLLVVRSTAEWP